MLSSAQLSSREAQVVRVDNWVWVIIFTEESGLFTCIFGSIESIMTRA